jgi:cytoskeletal protein CcmA (bactofilin family)
MFRSKPQPSIDVRRLSSLIAEGVHIVGDVIISDGLRVDGHIEGSIAGQDGSAGLLVLSEKGQVTGSVRVRDAVVNGTILGDIHVEHFLELQANARVTGNISYGQLQMACGATVEGRLDRLGEAAPAAGTAGNVVNLQRPAAAAGASD